MHKLPHFSRLAFTLAVALAATLPATATFAATKVDGTVEKFTTDAGGWLGRTWPANSANTFIDTAHGKMAPSLRQQFTDYEKVGLQFSNSDAGFIGDYAVVPSFTVGLDIDTLRLSEGDGIATRDVVAMFIDYKNPPKGFDGVSVSAVIGTLTQGIGWQHFQLTIPDTAATALPAGWSGTGAYDPVTGAPTLPADRTFASVLRNVDEIAFRTVQQANPMVTDTYDVAIDNVFVSANCPAGAVVSDAAGAGHSTQSPFKRCR